MANLYVAKNGSDANTGADWANALLTIGAAVSAAASGDTIYIAGGVYNEALSWSSKLLVIRGVGRVVLDGNGLSASYGITADLTYGTVELHNVVVRNFTNGGIYANAGYSHAKVYNCEIRDCAGWAFYVAQENLTIEDSLIISPAGSGVCGYRAYNISMSVVRCTIIVGGTCVWRRPGFPVTVCADNLLSGAVLLSMDSATQCDYNCLDFAAGVNKTAINGTDYTSLAAHQATGYDANSLDSDSATELIDTAKGLYMLRPTSQLVRRGSTGGNIGWGGPALGASTNINTTIWDNPYTVSGAVVKNASGHWELDTGYTSATIRFGDGSGNAMDLGASRTIRYVRLSALETYPGSVIDYDTADSAPRQLTYRYKTAASTFLLSDNTGWTEVNRETDLLISANDRYFALEVTLRQDGV